MIGKKEAQYWFLKTVESFQNLPYLWGGDDPMSGFDCSGMVVEGLKSIGAIGIHRDYTAEGLWTKFHAQYEVPEASRGCLAFWFNSEGRATHVAVCLSSEVCLTADRGGSSTVGLTEAKKANAFIKIRPTNHRVATPKFVDIFK